MSKKVSGSKYQYQEVDRNGDLLPPYYRRNAMHPDGVSRVVTAKNYSHWKEKVAKLFEDYKKAQLGLVVNYPKLTYKEIGKEFLDYKKTFAKSTYNQNRQYFTNKILPFFGSMIVSKTTNQDCERFFNQLQKDYSSQVIDRTRMILNSFFEWNIENKKCLTENPMSVGLKKTIKRQYKKSTDNQPIIKLNEQMIIDWMNFVSDKPESIVYDWLTYNGARISEAVAVRVKDVDLFNNKLHINQQIQGDGGEGGHINIRPPKHHSIRDGVITPQTKDKVIQIISLDDLAQDDFFYTTKHGLPMTPNTFRSKHHDRLVKEFHIKYPHWASVRINPHMFRGYFQAKMSKSGMNAMTIAKLMGHKNINTTFKHYYFDFEDENPEEVFNPLANLLDTPQDVKVTSVNS